MQQAMVLIATALVLAVCSKELPEGKDIKYAEMFHIHGHAVLSMISQKSFHGSTITKPRPYWVYANHNHITCANFFS